jgi:NADH-quinone oxidoreductase subunit E
MQRVFSPQAAAEIANIRGRYPTNLAALIPTLFVAQRELGVIDEAAMQLVADTLDVPLTKVRATATFYTMFNKTAVGRYHVQVCKNISCYLRNSDAVTHELCRTLKIEPGETTPDNQFTLTEVECLAACGRAPVVQINEDYHEWQTPESIRAIINRLGGSA